MFKPRPHQSTILNYKNGKMGVSAVPGSGKTHTLSRLAANIIMSDQLKDDQEILIVTLVNSAVNNFSKKVEQFIIQAGLLPGYGYRVRTLHGLAHDIVRERPDIVGLTNRFQILDDREFYRIMEKLVSQWINNHPEIQSMYVDPQLNNSNKYRVQKDWQKLIIETATNFIRVAKDYELTPDLLSEIIQSSSYSEPLLDMGFEIYTQYQRALSFREAVDFDDLIRFAIKSLRTDQDYLARLKFRWPYILEDESQDSSRLQENILRLLSGENGNWVRVGDPNQAIYETFTTANPKYLKSFLDEPGVKKCMLPNSGRSTHSIISLANELIRWTNQEHPIDKIRDALSTPFIEPTPFDDPQPNPPDHPEKVNLYIHKLTPDEEIILVAKSIKEWLKTHPQETAAILVSRNERGAKIVEELKKIKVDYVEILKSSMSTRKISSIIATVLRFLSDPTSSSKLAKIYLETSTYQVSLEETHDFTRAIHDLIQKCHHLEDYIYPKPGSNWLEYLQAQGSTTEIINKLEGFRTMIARWQNAAILPIDQLILTFTQDLFIETADLALSHKIALLLENLASIHTDWQFPDFITELDVIALNERNFLGFSSDDIGFDPDQHKGKVTVATVHKSKGLEWDRVYILSVNNYDFPSCQPGDEFYSEKWILKDKINFQSETIAKLDALITNNLNQPDTTATQISRYKLASERLRLLFVGITRARKELIITWNSGKKGSSNPSLAFEALSHFWEKEQHAASK